MGMADVFGSEDRVQMRFSAFYELLKNTANATEKARIMENGIKTNIPHEYMLSMLTGEPRNIEIEHTAELEKALSDADHRICEMEQMICELKTKNECLLKSNEELRKNISPEDTADVTCEGTDDEQTATRRRQPRHKKEVGNIE